MARIDPTARVASGAKIADDVDVGPYCIIGPDVSLSAGVRLVSHVSILGVTTIGERTTIYPFASLGTPPQSVKYRGGATRLTVGAGCDIREHVTINIGTEDDRGVTEVGDRCFLMVGTHVGHDCKVGNDVIIANNVLLAGHVTIGNFVVFGGGAAVRQFVRIGDGAMIVGLSGVRADIIPWGLAHGAPLADLNGLNVVGMRRRGHSKADIQALRQGYEALFFGAGMFRERLERLEAEQSGSTLVRNMIAFIRAGGSHPLTQATRHSGDREEA